MASCAPLHTHEGVEAVRNDADLYLINDRPCCGAGTPRFVPWQDHAAEPKFICDVMTEGLAKQLRLYGVDAAAVEIKGKHARHLVYRSAMKSIACGRLAHSHHDQLCENCHPIAAHFHLCSFAA